MSRGWLFMDTLATSNFVLVVEDEPLLNLDVSEALRDDGLDPIQVDTAEAALAVLERRGDIRFVFTDVNLPGKIDGIALAEQIQRRWPQIDVLITSGQRQARLERSDLVTRHDRFVPKPYRAEAVARHIHEIIDAQAA